MTTASIRWSHGEATPTNSAPEAQFVLSSGKRLATRASMKAELREIELRIGKSPAPWTDDLVELAALGAAVTEAGPRGGRWLQRAKAQAMVVEIQSRLRAAASPRPEDFIKLVLAAGAASRDQPRPSRDVLCTRYLALCDLVDASASPSVELLMQLAKAGAVWGQAGPTQSLFQLREQHQANKLRTLALRAPQADDFIKLAVLEVALQAAQRGDGDA